MQHDLEANPFGIARLIKDNHLTVPAHQREYSWTTEEVSQLLIDINSAFEKGEDYFLGSVMLIKEGESQTRFNIVDGQQRIATVSLLISAIRNYFKENDTENERNSEIERDFLFKTDLRTRERDFNVSLSERDYSDFEEILTSPETVDSQSSKKLIKAYKECTKHVETILSSVANPVDKLLDLHDYLLNKAQVIAVKASNEASAYVIFETLNDRGIPLSLADLFKNYLFGLSADRLESSKAKWISMMGAFTSLEAEGELPDFIRYFWLSKYGYIGERQLFSELKKKINSKNQAVQFITELEEVSAFYLALENPSHDVWRKLGPDATKLVQNINLIKFVQYKPLMLAVLANISSERAVKAILAELENWAVRLVYGSGTRSGTIAEKFSEVAVKISSGEITTSAGVIEEMKSIIPDDDVFKAEFSSMNVKSAYVTRYLLRKIENKYRIQNGVSAEIDVSEDVNNVNLEHILPKKANLDNWDFDEDQHSAMLNRLGNQTLMLRTDNSAVGADDFAEKLTFYEASELLTTRKIKEDFTEWNPQSVNDRQAFLAEIAAQTWTK